MGNRAVRIVRFVSGSLLALAALAATGNAIAQAVEGGYRIFRPDGPGPHPALVFLSGCSGFAPSFAPDNYVRRAEPLRELGFVVVWADYLGKRNLKSCGGGGVTLEEAGQDAVAAATWLRSQPYVDVKRISAIGWSYGGGAMLAALASHSTDELVFSRAIVYYPYCGVGVRPWSNRIPVLVLLAGEDNVAPHSMCESALKTSSEKGDVKIINYPGAHHSFDSPGLPPKMEYPYGTLGYNPQAAAASWEEVKKFLQPTM